MPASGKPSTQSWTNLDAYEAEVIVLLAYVKLCFGTYQAGQDWAATLLLMPFKHCELRLINPVQSAQRQCVLCVELFDHSSLFIVESRACAGVVDAASAFLEMIPLADAYAPTSP